MTLCSLQHIKFFSLSAAHYIQRAEGHPLLSLSPNCPPPPPLFFFLIYFFMTSSFPLPLFGSVFSFRRLCQIFRAPLFPFSPRTTCDRQRRPGFTNVTCNVVCNSQGQEKCSRFLTTSGGTEDAEISPYLLRTQS